MPSVLITRSPIQFQHRPDGSIGVEGLPDVMLMMHEGQANAGFPDWEKQLNMPVYQEEWEALAVPRGMSGRFIRVVLMDESVTRLADHRRQRPAAVRIANQNYLLTLGHTGFGIGLVRFVFLVRQDNREDLEITADVDGDCLMGLAQLYDSGLADRAWSGLQQQIFSHTCTVVNQQPEDPNGTGQLVEVALVSEAEAGCPGARVLNWWEG